MLDTKLVVRTMRTYFRILVAFLSQIPFFGEAQDFWQPTNGPYGGIVYDLAVSPNGNIYAATDSGLFLTTDFGENWVDLKLPDSKAVAVNSDNDVFVGTNGYILRSTDNAVSWQTKIGITGTTITALDISPDDHIFVGSWGHLGGGSYYSEDNGESWEYIGLDFCIPRTFTFEYPDYIFAGTAKCGVERTRDPNSGWDTVNNGLTNTFVTSLIINSSNTLFVGTEEGVFRSEDNGNSWTPINNGLTNPSILSLAVNAQDQLFAGTHNGVFYSSDNGTNWDFFNTGLTDTVIYSFAIDSSSFIYAGSSIGLVYRSIQPTTSIKSSNNIDYPNFRLEQNYPNPFNSSTVISFSIPTNESVKLSIYNLHGIKITDLCNDRYTSGIYSIQWDGKNVPSGIYFIRLQVGQQIRTKKAILIK